MKILGIDYGRKKIGLAISEGVLAEPYGVIRYSDARMLGKQLPKIIKENGIEQVVVGVSEGGMAEETEKFSSSLSLSLSIPVENFDETLSTQEAQKLAMEAKVGRKKRKDLEDAYAATVMLQSYLDNYV